MWEVGVGHIVSIYYNCKRIYNYLKYKVLKKQYVFLKVKPKSIKNYVAIHACNPFKWDGH